MSGTGANKLQPAIKFCGIRTPHDAAAINAVAISSQLRCAGLVFWPASKRAVTDKQAALLANLIHPALVRVGVFVDDSIKHIAALYERGIIQVAQLHGTEDAAYIASLRKQAPGITIWQAFVVTSMADIETAQQSRADLVLLDAGKGSGNTFDWNLLCNMRRPYILAGGLSDTTIASALNHTAPCMVDVSSGIEGPDTPEGKSQKSPERIQQFLAVFTQATNNAPKKHNQP